jgi:hypothetical protein
VLARFYRQHRRKPIALAGEVKSAQPQAVSLSDFQLDDFVENTTGFLIVGSRILGMPSTNGSACMTPPCLELLDDPEATKPSGRWEAS